MTNTATPSTTQHRKVVPSEVGWQFVPQYYTFVNKQPDRLHCFYTKKSTFIHGTEGEDGKPCHGQQEIHQKITSLDFQDCKVFIHSVDAQSSADGGIIIQVIGEMSNRGEEWRKFVQTFFLAEQPNGYFVLNDIFRFLKEETVDSDEAREEEVERSGSPSILTEPPVVPIVPVEVQQEPSPLPTPAAPTPAAAPEPLPVEEPVTVTPIAEPEPTPAPEPEPEPEAPAVQAPSRPNGVQSQEAEKPQAAPSLPPAEKPKTPVPPPTAAAPPPQPAAPVPAPAPSAPKTWANLAANNSKKWGSAVAQESRGTTEVVAVPSPSPSTPVQSTSTPPPNRSIHSALVAAQAVNTPHCFVKGVLDPISQPALIQHLNNRFGATKEVDIVRSKACAFVEFTTVESARKAIIASLNQVQGGEGGVFIETNDGPIRIIIETKKERGDRPISRPRGGAPPAVGTEQPRGGAPGGGGAGGGSVFRGRGRGRGGPPPGKQ